MLFQGLLFASGPLSASGAPRCFRGPSSSKRPLTARGPLTARRCLVASRPPCCFILQGPLLYQGPLLLQGLLAALRPSCCFRAAKLTASGPLKMLLQGCQAAAGAPATSGVPYCLRPLCFSSCFLPPPYSLPLSLLLSRPLASISTGCSWSPGAGPPRPRGPGPGPGGPPP